MTQKEVKDLNNKMDDFMALLFKWGIAVILACQAGDLAYSIWKHLYP